MKQIALTIFALALLLALVAPLWVAAWISPPLGAALTLLVLWMLAALRLPKGKG